MRILNALRKIVGADKVIAFQKRGDGVHTPLVSTLDELIAEAFSLGAFNVSQYEITKPFDITIKFTRKGGSEIKANGENHNLYLAITDAIREAKLLGDV
ncbi:MAG TPA: hypothetical protein ENH82_19745 [bacterium]|nr:hypothetical protein [bacterium]